MFDINRVNNNFLAQQWKKRYEEQPDEIKKKLDNLAQQDIKSYQLKVIKRSRKYPKIGDIFQVQPNESITLYGIVINNHVNNRSGTDFLVIFIFNPSVDADFLLSSSTIESHQLLFTPLIVDKGYWTRGYFHTVYHTEKIKNIPSYSFYDIFDEQYIDEYERPVKGQSSLVGSCGVCTISGVASRINKELIISRLI